MVLLHLIANALTEILKTFVIYYMDATKTVYIAKGSRKQLHSNLVQKNSKKELHYFPVTIKMNLFDVSFVKGLTQETRNV